MVRWNLSPEVRKHLDEWSARLAELMKPKVTPTYEEDPEYHNRARRVTEWLKLGQQMQQKVPPLHPEIMALLYHEKSQAMFELARDWNIYCESGECERPDIATWNLLFPWDDWEKLIDEGRLYPVNVGEIPATSSGPVDVDITFEFDGKHRLPAPAIDTRFYNYAYTIPKDPPVKAPDPLRLADGTRLAEGLIQSVKKFVDETTVPPMFKINPGGTLNLEDQVKGYSWSINIEIMPTTMIVDPPPEREYDQETLDRIQRARDKP